MLDKLEIEVLIPIFFGINSKVTIDYSRWIGGYKKVTNLEITGGKSILAPVFLTLQFV